MTVSWAVAPPPGPETLIVYVVVSVGVTSIDPFRETLPIPLSMVTLVALVVVQESVTDVVYVIVYGVAVRNS